GKCRVRRRTRHLTAAFSLHEGVARTTPSFITLLFAPRSCIIADQRSDIWPWPVRRCPRMASDMDEAHHPLVRSKAQNGPALFEIRIPVGDEIGAITQRIGRMDEVQRHHPA